MIAQDGVAALLQHARSRTPLTGAGGYSGAALERVVAADGASLVVKHIAQATDLCMRLTHDTGRAAQLWLAGVLDRLPPAIDHAILATEREGDGWLIVMRDITPALLGNHRVLTRAESRRLLAAAATVHDTFRGEPIEGLCTLTDHLSLLSPQTAARERSDANPLFAHITRGWDAFADVVPQDIADAITAIHAEPARLAEQLARRETTLIHGDLFLANLGLLPDRVVMLDWGLATLAPPALEFTTYLTGNWSRIAATREHLIDDFREFSAEHFDQTALRLAFIATFAEYGWNKALDAVEHPDPAVQARESADLRWWIARVRRALDVWSPV